MSIVVCLNSCIDNLKKKFSYGGVCFFKLIKQNYRVGILSNFGQDTTFSMSHESRRNT